MNQSVAAPHRLQPAACPLLAAVLPVRYAIGPLDPRHPSSLSAAALGLPELGGGGFPDLGPDHPQNQGMPLGYVPRMLRDGWLYLWDESLSELSEYVVRSAMLTPTGRGSSVPDQASRPYLMLEAGAVVRLVWSPVKWCDAHFERAEQQPELRSRLMREIVPGAGPFSGQVQSLHPEIGDVKAENFRWSCAPKPSYWLLQDPPLKNMKRCEQQHFAVVDDPWGVLLDTAGLMRARAQAFDKLNRHRSDEWSIAAIVRSMGESNEKLRARMASIVNLPQIQRALHEQALETSALEADHKRLADIWASWFNTLGDNEPSSLESACEHFDISEPAARDMLEASFTAALLGPAATSPGVKAIQTALDPAQVKGQPVLLWALLGLTQRVDAGDMQKLLAVTDDLLAVAPDTGAATVRMTRVSALVAALNTGAEKVSMRPLASGGDPLFAVVSPVLAGHLSSLPEQVHQATYSLMIAMLARSRQCLEVEKLAPETALRWMSEQVEGSHNNGQRRSREKRRNELDRQQARAARSSTQSAPEKNPLATQVNRAIPHLRLVRTETPEPPITRPEPGYGSAAPQPRPAPAPALPPLSGKAAGLELPRNVGDLLNDAPLKTLIVMVSVWNLKEAGQDSWQDLTMRNTVAAASAFTTTAAASAALLQHLAETRWEQQIGQTGHLNAAAQGYLGRALGTASAAMLFQAITASVDVFYFGWRALDAYRAGDLDSAGVNAGLAGASLAYAKISVEAMRALRIARTAVLAGDAKALATGLRVLSLGLRLTLVGLAITIVVGLIMLYFTEDEPLERWLKQTRFGNRPADWSRDFVDTLRALYQIVLPVGLKLERWQEINPRTGRVMRELRLVLRLPGQRSYRQGMVSFEGEEEWKQSTGVFSSVSRTRPLVWEETDPIPFDPDIGTRIPGESGGIRLRRAYHDEGESRLVAVRGRLTYQPIEGLLLPPIDIEVT